MTHAWCRDIPRDEAVRAAEDGRAGPFPTLEAVIAEPFAEPAKCSPSVSETGEGQSGLRTERVTLELTLDARRQHHLPAWNDILRDVWALWPTESVRVVEDQRESHLEAQRGVIDTLTRQRDAAIRERDEIRQSWLRSEESGTRLLAERNTALDAADGLRKQVAELKDKSHARWVSMNKSLCELAETRRERDAAKARVAELEAASGGGEPDAWGVVRDGNVESVTHRRFRGEAECCAARLVGTVVPLYRSPPQPRGWLTRDEIAACVGLRDYCRSTWETWGRKDNLWRDRADVLNALLARSSPPEVVLPDADCSWCSDYATVWRECLEAVRSSLAAAGVVAKEVQ